MFRLANSLFGTVSFDSRLNLDWCKRCGAFPHFYFTSLRFSLLFYFAASISTSESEKKKLRKNRIICAFVFVVAAAAALGLRRDARKTNLESIRVLKSLIGKQFRFSLIKYLTLSSSFVFLPTRLPWGWGKRRAKWGVSLVLTSRKNDDERRNGKEFRPKRRQQFSKLAKLIYCTSPICPSHKNSSQRQTESPQ